MPWIVVSTYYKHGEYNVDYFVNDSELETHLENFLTDEGDYSEDEISDMCFDDLISESIELGKKIVDQQQGTGIQEIIDISDPLNVKFYNNDY